MILKLSHFFGHVHIYKKIRKNEDHLGLKYVKNIPSRSLKKYKNSVVSVCIFLREREEIFFHIFRALISGFLNFGLDLQKKVPNHASEHYLPKENMLRRMIWQFFGHSNVKTIRKIAPNFMTFSENLNFTSESTS